MIKITHEERFSEMELFRMFNIECNPNIDAKETRVRYEELPYVFNDIKVPLLRYRKAKKVKGEKRHRPLTDKIKPGITDELPGSSRVADLVKFYATASEREESAFEI